MRLKIHNIRTADRDYKILSLSQDQHFVKDLGMIRLYQSTDKVWVNQKQKYYTIRTEKDFKFISDGNAVKSENLVFSMVDKRVPIS